jgi:hypothetical protein
MAGSDTDVVVACEQIKNDTQTVSDCAAEGSRILSNQLMELQGMLRANRNNGPRAMGALQEAQRSLGDVHVQIEAMRRAIDSYIDEEIHDK